MQDQDKTRQQKRQDQRQGLKDQESLMKAMEERRRSFLRTYNTRDGYIVIEAIIAACSNEKVDAKDVGLYILNNLKTRPASFAGEEKKSEGVKDGADSK